MSCCSPTTSARGAWRRPELLACWAVVEAACGLCLSFLCRCSYGVSYPQVQTQYDAVAKQMDADSGIVAKVAQLTQWNDTLAPNVLLDYTQV